MAKEIKPDFAKVAKSRRGFSFVNSFAHRGILKEELEVTPDFRLIELMRYTVHTIDPQRQHRNSNTRPDYATLLKENGEFIAGLQGLHLLLREGGAMTCHPSSPVNFKVEEKHYEQTPLQLAHKIAETYPELGAHFVDTLEAYQNRGQTKPSPASTRTKVATPWKPRGVHGHGTFHDRRMVE